MPERIRRSASKSLRDGRARAALQPGACDTYRPSFGLASVRQRLVPDSFSRCVAHGSKQTESRTLLHFGSQVASLVPAIGPKASQRSGAQLVETTCPPMQPSTTSFVQCASSGPEQGVVVVQYAYGTQTGDWLIAHIGDGSVHGVRCVTQPCVQRTASFPSHTSFGCC